MRFYSVYKFIFLVCKPLLKYILNYRVKKGKEDPNRYIEKMGIPSKQRPAGKIIWIYAVSVGESVSTLSLINQLEKWLHSIINNKYFIISKIDGKKIAGNCNTSILPV